MSKHAKTDGNPRPPRERFFENGNMLSELCSYLWVDGLLAFKCTNKAIAAHVRLYWTERLPAWLRKRFTELSRLPESYIDTVSARGGLISGALLFAMMCAPNGNRQLHPFQCDVVISAEAGTAYSFEGEEFRHITSTNYNNPKKVVVLHRVGHGLMQMLPRKCATIIRNEGHRSTIGPNDQKSSDENVTIVRTTCVPTEYINCGATTGFERCSFDGKVLRIKDPRCFIDRTSDYRRRQFTRTSPADIDVILGEQDKTAAAFAEFRLTVPSTLKHPGRPLKLKKFA